MRLSLASLTDKFILFYIMYVYSFRTYVGQYADYVGHLPASGSDTPPSSNTPTYATVSIPIRRHRWNQVPFIVTSGKQLEQKASYVRIVFKCEHEPCRSRQVCQRRDY